MTVTGGLPYMGGPGNNYSLHAIAAMVSRLRSRGKGHGLVTANGLYLTKHSLGLYSTEPGEHEWQLPDTSGLQQQIDKLPTTTLADDPAGEVIVETFTVSFGRNGPESGIVFAKNSRGERILALTRTDSDTTQPNGGDGSCGEQGPGLPGRRPEHLRTATAVGLIQG